MRTDFILSAEIVAITYSTVSDLPLTTQIAVLLAVGIGITVAVYGFVALIVKADDFGVWLAKAARTRTVKAIGRGIVRLMPPFLTVLSWIGTAAMLWVGAGIVIHGVPAVELWIAAAEAALPFTGAVAWIAHAAFLMVIGVLLGLVVAKTIVPVLGLFKTKS